MSTADHNTAPGPTSRPGLTRAQGWIIIGLMALAALGVWTIVVGDAIYLWDWISPEEQIPRRYYDDCDPASDCPADFGWFSPAPGRS